MNTEDAFKTNEKLNQQSLFREREVDNLNQLIYGVKEGDKATTDIEMFDE